MVSPWKKIVQYLLRRKLRCTPRRILNLPVDIQLAELRRHAESLAKLAATLEQAEDFPNETAREFCGIIRASARLIYQRIAIAPPDRFSHIHFILAALGEDLRYADRSRVEHTPWSLVQAMERFLQATLGSEYQFIIRPQWSYNYAIVGDRVAYYRRLFSSFPDWIPISEWHATIKESASHRIFIISFPRVERMNVLTHANWGHEIGHILISEWMAEHFDELWQREAPAIEAAIRDYVQNELGPPVLADEIVADYMKRTLSLTRKSLKELISDAIGAHILGPAALASLCEFSSRFELDANPLECGDYPPWRFRLTKIIEILLPELQAAMTEQWHPALRSFVKWLEDWRQVLTSSNADRVAINSDVRSKKAYELLETNYERIRTEVLGSLRSHLQSPYSLAVMSSSTNTLICCSN